MLTVTAAAFAQPAGESAGPAPVPAPAADDPLARPLVDAPAEFAATRASAWEADGARYLLLEGDARFAVGVFGFRGDRAVVRIDTERAVGRTIRHVAVYLENARSVHADDRGKAAVQAAAPRLLVTAATTGGVTLATDLLTPLDAPPADRFVADAEDRFARYYRRRATAVLDVPQIDLFGPDAEARREARRQQLAREGESGRVDLPDAPPRAAPPSAAVTPVLPTKGTVRFAFDRVVYQQAEAGSGQDDVLMLIGDVRVSYEGYDPVRQVLLSSEKAVVFLDPADADSPDEAAAAGLQQVQAGAVRGVYLEDNAIVTDGDYTVRAPRIYYDLKANKAVLLDAVLYTWDARRSVPLYMRAEVLRQTSADSFEAEKARLTTSEFGEPHFAIGARRITVRELSRESGRTDAAFTAAHNTFRVAGVPVFYWPYLAGETRNIPIRRIGVGANDDGVIVETAWDLFALTGREVPDGVDAVLELDYRGEHGPGVGVGVSYDREGKVGGFDGYVLPIDDGTDDIADRRDVEQDNETRGYARWQHRQTVAETVDVYGEVAYVSDETLLEELFRDLAYEEKQFETSLLLSAGEDDWQAQLYGATRLSDFVEQLTTLQAPGYTVDRFPEAGVHVVGGSLFRDRVTWHSENRLGYLRINPGDDAPEDRGFFPGQSLDAFGIAATTAFDDALDGTGISDEPVARFDTRQELAAPLTAGPVGVTPYGVGRFTAYSEEFEEFSGEDDQFRLWGQLGVRLHTELSRAYEGESDLLDVNGIRHVIEPIADLSWAESNINRGDLPIYDPEVESLATGGIMRVGLLQTLQTRRGGPGRWRSVDWITLQTDYVFRLEEDDDPPASGPFGVAGDDSPLPRYFAHRPEFTTGGDHFYTHLLWMVTDSFGLAGEMTYATDEEDGDDGSGGGIAQWRVGATLDQSPRLRVFLSYESVDPLDIELLTYGLAYELTAKYRMSVQHRLDFGDDDRRFVDLQLDRALPRWTLRFAAQFDQIEDEQTFGILLLPQGLTGRTRPVSLVP